MKASHLTSPPPGNERALLIGLETPEESKWDHAESLQELGELVKSAGGEVVETAIQRRPAPTAAYYIGAGKANELAALCRKSNVGTVIFNDELSPAQSRNLEKVFERKILDRTQLILDIFAQRAKSKDGKLQIELAQLQYLLPRLTGMWTHLSRQSGGIGTRGPGETQLEVDRRRVQEKIARLSRELGEVRQQRTTQRQGRLRQHWPIASIVGYTNAGKSTLLNRMTNAEVYAADQLFATLDPTTRQFVLPNKQKLLLTDTVGFLKQLPHHLIESFKATLEEVSEADLLLHVVDLSHPLYEQQMEAVQTVLEELNAWGKQMIVVFNKIDRVTNPALVEYALHKNPGSVAISATMGEGLDQLFGEIEHQVKSWRLRVKLVLPNHLTALVAELHRVGRVLDISYQDDSIFLTVHVPPQLQGKIKPYMVAEEAELAGKP
ncbi:MAG TPA: GTPase HflX [Candidatus Methylacidiphilales bacterium]|nr:GTPase HflX [Candidatus Methylacidiphilales bacterium]